MESRLKIDNEERMRRLATFQELASNRMAIQQQSLGPLMVNLKQSHAELTEAENLQVPPLHSSILCRTHTSQSSAVVRTVRTMLCLYIDRECT